VSKSLAKSLTVADARRKTYLASLAKTGCVHESAKAAGITTMAVSLWRHTKNGLEFVEQEKLAREQFVERLEKEMIRRAVEGVEETVWFKGQKVGTKKSYSDVLLIALAKANSQKYADSLRIGGSDQPIRVLSMGVNLDAKEVHDAVDQLLVAATCKEAGSNGSGGNGRLTGRNGTGG